MNIGEFVQNLYQ